MCENEVNSAGFFCGTVSDIQTVNLLPFSVAALRLFRQKSIILFENPEGKQHER